MNLDWAALIPDFNSTAWSPHWWIGSNGMTQARQVIAQLEHESYKCDPLAM